MPLVRRLAVSPYNAQLGAKVNLPALPLPNTDLVAVNGMYPIPTTGGDFSSAAPPGTSFLNKFKPERIRQDCTVTKLRLHVRSLPDTAWNFCVRRLVPATGLYHKVSEQNILSLLTANSINEITLPVPIDVLEGDFYGFTYSDSAGGDNCTYIKDTIVGSLGMKYSFADTTAADYAWDTQPNLQYFVVALNLAPAPLMGCIGDSIMESYPVHSSMIQYNYTEFDTAKSWQYKLRALNSKFTYQNVGVSEPVTPMEARFDRDLVSCKPKFAVINGGLNDGGASTTVEIYVAKWTSILDKCVANNIIPIVWLSTHANNFTTEQCRLIDSYNDAVTTLFNTYAIEGSILIDVKQYMCQFRPGGDAGNLWDIKTALYAGDNYHFNEDGQAALAQMMLTEFGKIYKLT